jgi:hypothetical protein
MTHAHGFFLGEYRVYGNDAKAYKVLLTTSKRMEESWKNTPHTKKFTHYIYSPLA